jgi:hypothetical protein
MRVLRGARLPFGSSAHRFSRDRHLKGGSRSVVASKRGAHGIVPSTRTVVLIWGNVHDSSVTNIGTLVHESKMSRKIPRPRVTRRRAGDIGERSRATITIGDRHHFTATPTKALVVGDVHRVAGQAGNGCASEAYSARVNVTKPCRSSPGFNRPSSALCWRARRPRPARRENPGARSTPAPGHVDAQSCPGARRSRTRSR